MRVDWPEKVKPQFRVCHPINTAGTTWLRESDLVFLHKRPYAVLSWSHTDHGDVPEMYCELNPSCSSTMTPTACSIAMRARSKIRASNRVAGLKACRAKGL